MPFERYADDIVCHCRTEREALALRQALDRRFNECGLVLHPEKTKLVYCKDTNRKRDYGVIQFDFLGYTFRPRLAKWKGGLFGVSYLPAAGPKALKAMRQTIRGWTLQTRSDKALDDLARMFNPYIRGWINYYSHFYKSALYPTLRRIDVFLIRWARRKFKRLRQQPKGARDWLARWSEHRRTCLLIGRFCMAKAGHWEPYEPRGSRTVLRARGGVIPSRDSLLRLLPG